MQVFILFFLDVHQLWKLTG
uniref:Uncharacterized protein n=1 Tax=Anguilla anguilla TaxID=7936 RepID=A0A0E9S729_ANGAN